jgi:hypothetical protein
MTSETQRVANSGNLGRAGQAFDLALGVAATIPILVCAVLARLVPADLEMLVRTSAVIWASSLLAFFAGVRRGLIFSEAGGGGWRERITILAIFALGIAAMLFCSLIVAAVGLACVGGLDALSARRGEAPRYFSMFRSLQMAVCAAALVLVAVSRR